VVRRSSAPSLDSVEVRNPSSAGMNTCGNSSSFAAWRVINTTPRSATVSATPSGCGIRPFVRRLRSRVRRQEHRHHRVGSCRQHPVCLTTRRREHTVGTSPGANNDRIRRILNRDELTIGVLALHPQACVRLFTTGMSWVGVAAHSRALRPPVPRRLVTCDRPAHGW
jgi:hypothetical protein